MDLVILFLAVGCCVYTVAVVILIAALGRVRTGSIEDKPYVTVVMAAHNERASIGVCLASIMAQDYPEDSFEVIVADDRSTDGTTDVLKHFQENRKNLSFVIINSTPKGVSPKKHALSQAIRRARGDIILQTDADCIVPVSWISGMVRGFEDDVVMAAGLSPYIAEPGVLNSFVCHEYLWNAALQAGSTALGSGTHASGRNLAFRRDVFENYEGYGPSEKVKSGDDTLLLHRMKKLSGSRVITVADVSTHVYTRAPCDFGTFIRQRIRHMSTGRFFNPFYIMLGCAVYGFHLLLLLSLFFSIYSLKLFVVLTAVFIWKILVDGIAAWRTESVLGLDVQWKRFVINEMLLVAYMAFMPFLGIIVPVKWKEK